MIRETHSSSVARLAVEEHAGVEGGLLPALHQITKALGYIPEQAISELAAGFNLGKAEVYGVISFYHDFSLEPLGDHVVQICRAEACQAQGGRDVENAARDMLKMDFDQTSADGKITLKSVYCLGNCVCGPNVSINGRLHARVDKSRLSSLINTCLSGED